MENYATLANVSAWLMIFYFTVAIITAAMLTAIAIYKPENFKYPKKKFVNKIISLLTSTYGVALAFSKLAIHVYKKEYKEFNK